MIDHRKDMKDVLTGIVHKEEKSCRTCRTFVIQSGVQRPVFKYLDNLPGFSETLTSSGGFIQWESEVLHSESSGSLFYGGILGTTSYL